MFYRFQHVDNLFINLVEENVLEEIFALQMIPNIKLAQNWSKCGNFINLVNGRDMDRDINFWPIFDWLVIFLYIRPEKAFGLNARIFFTQSR